MDDTSRVPASPLRERAEDAFSELLEVADASMTSASPELAAGLLMDVVRASAELRARAERDLGQLLVDYPDAGGRPPTSSPLPVSRQLRRIIDVDRTHHQALRALAKIPRDVFEELMAVSWSGYPRGGCVARALVREAKRLQAKATPSKA